MNAPHPPWDPAAGVVGVPAPHDSATLHVAGEAATPTTCPEPRGTLHAALGVSPHRARHDRAPRPRRRARAPGVVAVSPRPTSRASTTSAPSRPTTRSSPSASSNSPDSRCSPSPRPASTPRAAPQRWRDVDIAPLPALLTIDEALAAQSYVLPPVHVTRGDAAGALAAAPHRLQRPLRVRRPGPLLPGRTDRARDPARARRHAGLHVDAASGRSAAHGRARARRSPITTSSSNAGAWAAASAARKRRCRSSRASRRCWRARPAARSSCGSTATTTCARPASGTRSSTRTTSASTTTAASSASTSRSRRAAVSRPTCRVRSTIARCSTSTTATGCRTSRSIRIAAGRNTVSDTAFRGFGGPQGMFAIETVLDDIARTLRLDPLDVRKATCTARRAQRHAVRHDGRGQHRARADRRARSARGLSRAAARRSPRGTATSPIIKRGIALTPVKFGISFTATHYNQAGALSTSTATAPCC